jgi:hypothetical protein
MQNMFQKLAITAILSLGISSSLMANDDLLSLATNNSTDISGAKMLSQDEMKDVVGGALTSFATTYGSGFKQNSATITEGCSGYQAKIFYRILNGSESVWINLYKNGLNGAASYAYSAQASALIAQYGSQIKNR